MSKVHVRSEYNVQHCTAASIEHYIDSGHNFPSSSECHYLFCIPHYSCQYCWWRLTAGAEILPKSTAKYIHVMIVMMMIVQAYILLGGNERVENEDPWAANLGRLCPTVHETHSFTASIYTLPVVVILYKRSLLLASREIMLLQLLSS